MDRNIQRIAEAGTIDEIITVLAECGNELAAVASRLSELERFVAEDDDESPMRLDSARAMTIFLILSQGQFGRPRIAVDPAGLLLVEYGVAESGILAVEFLSADFVRYAAVSAAATADGTRLRINGTVPASLALEMVRLFVMNVE